MIPAIKDTPFPHADSPAARALQLALNRAKVKNKTSLRALAKQLNYKQAAVLSHMANGRIPIPVERAEEIATALDLNPNEFIKLVLKQRYPKMSLSLDDVETNSFALESEFNHPGLGLELSSATPSQMRIIREVLRDTHASERWLFTHEVYYVKVIRKLRPDVVTDGLSPDDLQRLSLALTQTAKQQQSGN